ncbi:MAG: PilN domain-containing protein [Candidatus Saccharibacteria bacterium]|nr:MAG: PilN domain-containing protein [Candidatus Saccharibacteria bacterium]
MINLLPHEEKRQLRAARSNTLLVRYNILLIAAVGFLAVAVGITFFYLTTTKTAAENTINQNTTKVSSFSSVEAEATQFKSDLAIAKQIIDREVAYTKVILGISKLLPSGVVLENLSLDAQTFGTETTLVAHAKSYNAAIALKDSFQKSPLFSDVHFQSISSGEGDTSGYPFTVNLNITIIKDAAK